MVGKVSKVEKGSFKNGKFKKLLGKSPSERHSFKM
jgi:hypothetical protein